MLPRPAADPWCSGSTCQPVTLEIAGSNPVGSARSAFGSLHGIRLRDELELLAAFFTAWAVASCDAASLASRSR